MSYQSQDQSYADIKSRHAVTFRSMQLLRARWQERQRQRKLRAELQQLLQMEDRIFRDIGISRGDVMWAASQPIDRDPAKELGWTTDAKKAA